MAINCFRVFFFIVVLMVIPQGVNCLSCYTCTSEDSWEDCNSNMTTRDCPSGSPNCAKSELTCSVGGVTNTVFYKRCGAQGKDCSTTSDDTPSCPNPQSFSWSFFRSEEDMCCTGNNCNSGSSNKLSSALTGVSIVLVLWGLHTFVY